MFTLMGGIAMFLYGMDLMGKALEQTAGSKLQGILSKMTASPVRGLLLGMVITMMNGVCRVLATTWEWEEDIDAERAEAAKHRAEQALANGGLTDKEYRIAEAKLQRALVRLSVKE